MNNSSGSGGCFAMIVCGILFILGPIVVLLYGFSCEEVYIRWSCLVWLVILACLFAFIRDNTSKFTLGALTCLVYAIIFCSYYSEYEVRGDYSDGGLGDLIGFFLFPFTMLVPMYFFGEMISAKIERKRQEKRESKAKKIELQINACRDEMEKMEKNIKDRKHTLKLIHLFKECGADTKNIMENSEFLSIENTYIMIEDKKKTLKELQTKLKAL